MSDTTTSAFFATLDDKARTALRTNVEAVSAADRSNERVAPIYDAAVAAGFNGSSDSVNAFLVESGIAEALGLDMNQPDRETVNGKRVRTKKGRAFNAVQQNLYKACKRAGLKNNGEPIEPGTDSGDETSDEIAPETSAETGTTNLLTAHGVETLAGKSVEEIAALVMAELTARLA